MSRQIMLPPLRRNALVRADSFDEEANTIEVVFTTGATVRRASWREGEFDEELIVTAQSVRLDRLNAGAPFLDTHDSYSLGGVIGSVVPGTARVADGQGLATIRLSRRAETEGVVSDIRDGIINNVSVGYRTHRVEIQERDGAVPLHRAIDWEPYEISAVPIPADPGAQVRSADGGPAPTLNVCAVTGAGVRVQGVVARMRMRGRAAGLGR